MKQEHKDKTLSSIVALITLTLVVYLVFQSGIVDVQEGKTLKDLFSMLMAQYPVSYTHLPSPRDKRQARMPSSA